MNNRQLLTMSAMIGEIMAPMRAIVELKPTIRLSFPVGYISDDQNATIWNVAVTQVLPSILMATVTQL